MTYPSEAFSALYYIIRSFRRCSLADYIAHPAILDAALHVSVHPYITGYGSGPRYYLPSKIGVVTIHDALTQRRLTKRLWAYCRMTDWDPSKLNASHYTTFCLTLVIYRLHPVQCNSTQRHG